MTADYKSGVRIMAADLLSMITENMDEIFDEDLIEAIKITVLWQWPSRSFMDRTMRKLGFKRKSYYENGYKQILWIRKLSRTASPFINTMATTIDTSALHADNESIKQRST